MIHNTGKSSFFSSFIGKTTGARLIVVDDRLARVSDEVLFVVVPSDVVLTEVVVGAFDDVLRGFVVGVFDALRAVVVGAFDVVRGFVIGALVEVTFGVVEGNVVVEVVVEVVGKVVRVVGEVRVVVEVVEVVVGLDFLPSVTVSLILRTSKKNLGVDPFTC